MNTVNEKLVEYVEEGNIEGVKHALEMGADVNAKDMWGGTALILSAFFGYKSIVKLLIDAGADVDAQDNNGQTALMAAALFGYESIAELLIKNGADVNVKDKDGMTAQRLMWAMRAMRGGKIEIVDMLKSANKNKVIKSHSFKITIEYCDN